MTRFASLILWATLGTALLACGSNGTSSKDPLTLVPQNDAVSGWTVDPANARTSSQVAATGVTELEVEGLIDGGAGNYFQDPNLPKMFLWQNYANTTWSAAPEGATVKLYIFEMPSAGQAKGIYTALLEKTSYAAKPWEPTTPTVGTESRIQDTATQWWVNFHHDVFYVEVLLSPSFGPPPDYALSSPETKQEAVRFAQAIDSKI